MAYSHIREVYTLAGSDEHEGGKAYTGTEIKGQTPERRDALAVVFDGECEHSWRLIVQQHKGVDLLRIEEVPQQ